MPTTLHSPNRAALQVLVEARKATTLGHILARSSRLLQAHALVALHQAGFSDVQESWLGVLRHLEPEGVRSSVLATRLGISKQAAGQLVTDLERKGYLERVADPADGRAKLVRLTEKGWAVWLAGLDALIAQQERLAARLGPDVIDALIRDGSALLTLLENPMESSHV